jgi:hypothetical protein
VAVIAFIYFLPVLFIIFTAIKPQALALSVPPTISPTSLFGLIPEQYVFTPTLENFGSVFERSMTVGRRAGTHRVRPLFLQLDLHLDGVGSAGARDRHAGGLRLFALSAQGQRHLPLHHPDDAHAACHRRGHPGHPDVPGGGALGLLHRASSCSIPPSTSPSRSG